MWFDFKPSCLFSLDILIQGPNLYAISSENTNLAVMSIINLQDTFKLSF